MACHLFWHRTCHYYSKANLNPTTDGTHFFKNTFASATTPTKEGKKSATKNCELQCNLVQVVFREQKTATAVIRNGVKQSDRLSNQPAVFF